MLHLKIYLNVSRICENFIEQAIIYTDISIILKGLELMKNDLFKEDDKILKDFFDFYNQYQNIVIYGAGKIATIIADFLDSKFIKYDYFVVTTLENNNVFHCNHDVKEFDSVKSNLNNTGIIIALMEADSVIKKLNNYGITYFWNENFFTFLRREKIRNEINGKVYIKEKLLCTVGNFYFKKNIKYICCPYGIGDTLYIASLVKAYKMHNNSIKKVYLIVKQTHEKLVYMFDGIDGNIVSNELVELLTKYSLYTQTWELKNYLYGHFKTKIDFKFTNEFYDESNSDMISKYKKLVMNLPYEAEMGRIIINGNKNNNLNINRKTIIIMPYAKSIHMLPSAFWEKLCIELTLMGYYIYTNVADINEKPIKGTIPLQENISDTAVISEMCKAVIALRSGLCDLLAFTNAKLIIINTDFELCNAWNLENVFPEKDITNVNCYEEDSYELAEEKIKTIIKKM